MSTSSLYHTKSQKSIGFCRKIKNQKISQKSLKTYKTYGIIEFNRKSEYSNFEYDKPNPNGNLTLMSNEL